MEKLIELSVDSSIKVSNKVININKPEYVYIPILPSSKLLVKKGTNVKIGMPLISKGNDIITSPISGEVTSIKKVITIKGEIDAIEIKNDFTEVTIKESKLKKNILNIKKEVLDKILDLFKVNLNNKKEIVLNCIDDEPYILTESFYLFLEYTNFLEVLDKLSDIYKVNVSIAVKASNNFSINELMNYLGMYTNIKLEIIPNLYLLGNNKLLLKHLGLEEKDTEVIKASNFYHISNFIKKGRLKTDQLITISGNNIVNSSIIRVKIGTSLKEVFKSIKGLGNSSIFIVNGLMSGKEIDINNLVITNDLTGILVIKKETIEKAYKKEEKCLNCGACIDVCPVGINPLLLKEKNYKEKNKCLKCGLCSYICPVYINFNYSDIKGDNND
jgi:electron transport complex protein RnfC